MLNFTRWKVALILLIILIGAFWTIPNFISDQVLEEDWPDWLPGQKLVLGLDLQGGSYLLFEVDREELQKTRLNSLLGEVRNTLREQPRIGFTGLKTDDGALQVRIRESEKIEEAEERLKGLLQPIESLLFTSEELTEFELSIDEDGLATFTFNEEGLSQRVREVVNKSIEVVRNRIDQLGTTEPSIQRQGEDRILVEAPGEQNPERLKRLIGEVAKLTFHLIDDSKEAEEVVDGGRPPPGSVIMYGTDADRTPYLVEEPVLIAGEELNHAAPAFGEFNNPVVSFNFNTSGARKFGELTSESSGRTLAIVLDNEVVSAPVMNEPILGGSGIITSPYFTVEEVTEMALLLRSGALPAKLNSLEERSVGPGLGADSIEAGKIASIVAGVAVLIYMFLSYGLFGIIANLALLVNVTLIFGTLSVLGATLTLPGVAGIVLTIGMAVDANVLIFERIREEARIGRSAINAIDSGFKMARASILDANITTLIAAVVLFWLGSGPIKGFAVTLAIGIVTSVFSALFFTRLLIAQWIRSRRPSELPI